MVVAVATAGTLAAVAACSSGATSQSVNAPTRTVTATVTHQTTTAPGSTAPTPTRTAPASTRPAPGPTVTVTSTPTPAAPPAPPAPPAPTTPMTNASAVVAQYYQDITDHNYAAAWALGGANIAGESYDQYVAGFSTTASIGLGTVSDFGASQVQAVLYATQTDGTVKVFEGTYTVSNGVLVGASIRQIQ
ncbi:hypothetical protein SAMN05414137_109101 [Streptacidiphilus jiangxiensis]|uniref:Uncharacterized protein n=2 Tax=Streptacidiphilus jiangxiensis TaxID=235985 RepID=A0A1H7QLZ1_STRJI|nr:hypothetical protein SAMN05414137_109101 [Streptacidiphilus jiangxiensis]